MILAHPEANLSGSASASSSIFQLRAEALAEPLRRLPAAKPSQHQRGTARGPGGATSSAPASPAPRRAHFTHSPRRPPSRSAAERSLSSALQSNPNSPLGPADASSPDALPNRSSGNGRCQAERRDLGREAEQLPAKRASPRKAWPVKVQSCTSRGGQSQDRGPHMRPGGSRDLTYF